MQIDELCQKIEETLAPRQGELSATPKTCHSEVCPRSPQHGKLEVVERALNVRLVRCVGEGPIADRDPNVIEACIERSVSARREDSSARQRALRAAMQRTSSSNCFDVGFRNPRLVVIHEGCVKGNRQDNPQSSALVLSALQLGVRLRVNEQTYRRGLHLCPGTCRTCTHPRFLSTPCEVLVHAQRAPTARTGTLGSRSSL